jgi:adhesin/invasin
VATANLVSLVAADNQVTATVGANTTAAKTSTFIADETTAKIIEADFVVGSGALANGTAPNALTATVTDRNGNLLGAGIDVIFTVTGAATPATQTVKTNASGVATANLVSLVAADNQVTATVGANTTAAKTSAFVPPPAFTGITVNGHNFTVHDGFPTTGFTGAVFTLNVNGFPTDYNWASSAPSRATVDSSGNVSFTSQGSASPVTITATPTGGGDTLTYTVTVGSWFTNMTAMIWSDASTFCADRSLSQPTPADLTKGTGVRGVGSLWSEWGRMGTYSGSGFQNSNYWTSEASAAGSHQLLYLDNGLTHGGADINPYLVVCRQVL